MAFKVAARTLLELGSELISSDAIAIYELVKNAFDAGSKDVDVTFSVVLARSSYADVSGRLAREDFPSPSDALAEVRHRLLLPETHPTCAAFMGDLSKATGLPSFARRLHRAYVKHNTIRIDDRGHGMSLETLDDAFLTIGTPNRLIERESTRGVARRGAGRPILGEKGVGRLAAMRLGSRLVVRTSTTGESHWNVLEIDWEDFARDPTAMLEDVLVSARIGPEKANARTKGTRIVVSDLASDWSQERLADIARVEFSRLADPFEKDSGAFPLKITLNGNTVPIPPISRELFRAAHGYCSGHYTVDEGRPRLLVDFEHRTYSEHVTFDFGREELRDMIGDAVPESALVDLGPWSFEFYWFNRQRLAAVDGIGTQRVVKELVNHWSGGLMLFRDGFRVNPYGAKGDDWLDLNSEAFKSRGYLLNTEQIIGRINISGRMNPRLVDQTNREGLRDTFEKAALTKILRTFITRPLKSWIDETTDQYKGLAAIDLAAVDRKVSTYEKRIATNVKQLKKQFPGEERTIERLQATFQEMRTAYTRARDHGEKAEEERQRMLELAGIGLMVEVVAHELARSTQHTLHVLRTSRSSSLPADARAIFASLETQLVTIERRLRTLDPLSVAGRQRKTQFDLVQVVRDCFDNRMDALRAIPVDVKLREAAGSKGIRINAVRGMVVQILENLLTNSMHWLDVERRRNVRFRPEIVVEVSPDDGGTLTFTDNGPGIAPDFAELVFGAFYTTRSEAGGRGLGLFIARENARHHGGELRLSTERRIHPNRLNTFVLVMATPE